MFDATSIPRDGSVLAVLASGLIMGTLRANPRLFRRRVPDVVSAAQAPLSAREQAAGRVVAAVLIALLVAVPVQSALEIDQSLRELSLSTDLPDAYGKLLSER